LAILPILYSSKITTQGKKNVNFTEYKIDGDEDARALMIERADGRRTLPQIFIDNEGIGGCDDLYALEKENKLEALLN